MSIGHGGVGFNTDLLGVGHLCRQSKGTRRTTRALRRLLASNVLALLAGLDLVMSSPMLFRSK
jgi:hypothetical protein